MLVSDLLMNKWGTAPPCPPLHLELPSSGLFAKRMGVPLAEADPNPGRCWKVWDVASNHGVDTARTGLLRVRVWRLRQPEIPASAGRPARLPGGCQAPLRCVQPTPIVIQRGWRGGGSRPPFGPPARRAPVEVAEGGAAPFRPCRCGVMPERRTAVVTARVSAAEFADWRAKAAAAGVPLSALIRRAMALTRTWTARAAEVERERTREAARIGNNLNQIARWANTHKAAAEAVEVIARLVAIERALAALARFESPDPDAH